MGGAEFLRGLRPFCLTHVFLGRIGLSAQSSLLLLRT